MGVLLVVIRQHFARQISNGVGVIRIRCGLEHRQALNFRIGNGILPRQIGGDVRVNVRSQGLHFGTLVRHISAVQNQAAQRRVPPLPEVLHRHGDVGCRVDGHVLAGCDDVDSVGIALPNGHGEAAAHHIPQHIVEYHVRLDDVEGISGFQRLEGGGDASPGTAQARCGTAGFRTDDVLISYMYQIRQFRRISLLPKHVQHGVDALTAVKVQGGVRFRVTAYLQHAQPHFRKGTGQGGGNRGLSDASFSVYCKTIHCFLLTIPVQDRFFQSVKSS